MTLRSADGDPTIASASVFFHMATSNSSHGLGKCKSYLINSTSKLVKVVVKVHHSLCIKLVVGVRKVGKRSQKKI